MFSFLPGLGQTASAIKLSHAEQFAQEMKKIHEDFPTAKDNPEALIERLQDLHATQVARIIASDEKCVETLAAIEQCYRELIEFLIQEKKFSWKSFSALIFTKTGTPHLLKLANAISSFIESHVLNQRGERIGGVAEFYFEKAKHTGNEKDWHALIDAIEKTRFAGKAGSYLKQIIDEFAAKDVSHPLFRRAINVFAAHFSQVTYQSSEPYKLCRQDYFYLPLIKREAMNIFRTNPVERSFKAAIFLLLTTNQEYAINRFALTGDEKRNLAHNVNTFELALNDHQAISKTVTWYAKLYSKAKSQSEFVIFDPVHFIFEQVEKDKLDAGLLKLVEDDLLQFHGLAKDDESRAEHLTAIREMHAKFPATISLAVVKDMKATEVSAERIEEKAILQLKREPAGDAAPFFTFKVTTVDGAPLQIEGALGKFTFSGKGKGAMQFKLFGTPSQAFVVQEADESDKALLPFATLP